MIIFNCPKRFEKTFEQDAFINVFTAKKEAAHSLRYLGVFLFPPGQLAILNEKLFVCVLLKARSSRRDVLDAVLSCKNNLSYLTFLKSMTAHILHKKFSNWGKRMTDN